MTATEDGATLENLVARLARMEREVAALRAGRHPATAQPAVRAYLPEPEGAGEPETRPSRRGMLRTVLGVTAATVGAGALLEAGTRTALADNPGNFSSSTSTPAVTATATNGATGVNSSSQSW